MASFALDVAAFIKRANLAPGIVVRKVATDLLRSVVLKTPVDTGRARASWGVGLNRVNADVSVTVTDKSGQKTILAGLAPINQWKPDDAIVIASRLPYIKYLEYGWSRQAPAGMVRLSIIEAEQFINAAVRSLPDKP